MDDNRLYLIFEFLSMDLKKYMDTLPSEKMMHSDLVRSYMYQISAAMLFCHQRRILHRDLKPQNLLINKDGVIKVSGRCAALQLYDDWRTRSTLIVGFSPNRLPISDWVVLSAFPFGFILTRSSHCGIELPRCCWEPHGIHVPLTFGRSDAFSRKWRCESRSSKAIPRSISSFGCSGKPSRISCQRIFELKPI